MTYRSDVWSAGLAAVILASAFSVLVGLLLGLAVGSAWLVFHWLIG